MTVEVVVTTGASSGQIDTTNKPTPCYYRPDALLSPNQQCHSTEGKKLSITQSQNCVTYLLSPQAHDLFYRPVFQDNLGKPVPECQTVLDFTAVRDARSTLVPNGTLRCAKAPVRSP